MRGPSERLGFFICLFSRATGIFYGSHEEEKKKGSVQLWGDEGV